MLYINLNIRFNRKYIIYNILLIYSHLFPQMQSLQRQTFAKQMETLFIHPISMSNVCNTFSTYGYKHLKIYSSF